MVFFSVLLTCSIDRKQAVKLTETVTRSCSGWYRHEMRQTPQRKIEIYIGHEMIIKSNWNPYIQI